MIQRMKPSSTTGTSFHRRDESDGDGETSSTPFQLDQACKDFKSYFFNLADPLGTECKCRDDPSSFEESAFQISCRDQCEFCVGDNCATYQFNADIAYYDMDDPSAWVASYGKQCLVFDKDSYDGVTFCNEETVDQDITIQDIIIDGESCYSTNWYSSGSESYLAVDCNNLGYSSYMKLGDYNSDGTLDTSTTDGQGPFEFFNIDTDVVSLEVKDGCVPTSSATVSMTHLMLVSSILSMGLVLLGAWM